MAEPATTLFLIKLGLFSISIYMEMSKFHFIKTKTAFGKAVFDGTAS